MTNKIGDIALLLGIALLCNAFGAIDFATLNPCTELILSLSSIYEKDVNMLFETVCIQTLGLDSTEVMQYYIVNSIESNTGIASYLRAVCLLAVIAAIGKSAQAGLHM
jgi:NADH:ubiquinone oxidoreductase subunit 5 (subunit L)/multisubunit Na+/H+ antiporter MnhA subunit